MRAVSQCVRSHIDLIQSPIYRRFRTRLSSSFQGLSIDTKRMFTQKNLARESDVHVVETANLDQTVCYHELRLIAESYCVYIKIKML